MSYVVLVKPPDDHPASVRIYGVYRDRNRATEFCEKVRAVIDRDVFDETAGYAYVLPIERPKLKDAKAWATSGEPVAS